jgi:membrane protease YdiL (CAAX protease family)
MAVTRRTLEAEEAGGRRVAVVGLTILILAAAVAASVLVAVANQAWFDLVNGAVGARETVARGLLFSSWPLLLGGAVVIWRPRTFGFQAGETRRQVGLVAGVVGAAAALTALLLTLVGPTPYSDASPFIEVVVVPFTEELLFRGVLLTVLLLALTRLHDPGTAALLAVAFDGVAFGIAHLANAGSIDVSFVVPQVAFAIALGTACAGLAVRTRSIYPAMLLHGVVNGVVVVL